MRIIIIIKRGKEGKGRNKGEKWSPRGGAGEVIPLPTGHTQQHIYISETLRVWWMQCSWQDVSWEQPLTDNSSILFILLNQHYCHPGSIHLFLPQCISPIITPHHRHFYISLILLLLLRLPFFQAYTPPPTTTTTIISLYTSILSFYLLSSN